jgi:hypothetical protein
MLCDSPLAMSVLLPSMDSCSPKSKSKPKDRGRALIPSEPPVSSGPMFLPACGNGVWDQHLEGGEPDTEYCS